MRANNLSRKKIEFYCTVIEPLEKLPWCFNWVTELSDYCLLNTHLNKI